jgi:hypothetical protein
MMPNAQERIWLEPVDLWIGLGDKVVLYDKSGTPIPNYTQLTGKFEEVVAEVEAEAEARRRETEARRAAEAKVQVEIEARRVAEAKAKAEAEAKAKMAVELAHLRAELARARGE